jgi:hypothetical protein
MIVEADIGVEPHRPAPENIIDGTGVPPRPQSGEVSVQFPID